MIMGGIIWLVLFWVLAHLTVITCHSNKISRLTCSFMSFCFSLCACNWVQNSLFKSQLPIIRCIEHRWFGNDGSACNKNRCPLKTNNRLVCFDVMRSTITDKALHNYQFTTFTHEVTVDSLWIPSFFVLELMVLVMLVSMVIPNRSTIESLNLCTITKKGNTA